MTVQVKKQREFPQSGCIDHSLSLAPHVQENAISYIENLSTTDKEIFNVLIGIYMTTKYSRIHPSLDYIAEKTNKSLATVKRATKRFSEDGLLSKHQSGFNKSNFYRLHPMFEDKNVRKELRFVFRCFYFIPIALLMSVPGWSNVENQRKHYIFSRVSSYQEKRNKVNNNLPNPPITKSPGFSGAPGRKSQKGGGDIRKERIKRMDPRDYKNIERLNLTEAGVIKLSAFPPEAIAAAMIRLQGLTKPVDDIFRFVFAVSKQWCEGKGIKPNFRESTFLLKEKGYSFDTPSIDAESPVVMKKRPDSTKEKNRTDQVIAQLTKKREISPEREVAAQEQLKAQVADGDIWTQLILGLANPN